MVHDKQTAFRVLAKYLKRNDPGFLEEMYAIACEFTDRVPRVDAWTVATVLEFERVQGVDPTTLSRKVIDNSMVEKFVQDGFIEKLFSKRNPMNPSAERTSRVRGSSARRFIPGIVLIGLFETQPHLDTISR